MESDHLDKLFEKLTFVNTREGRPIKIMTEFMETKSKLEEQSINNTIVMFGSARIPSKTSALETINNIKTTQALDSEIQKATYELEISEYYEKARELAFKLATWSKKFEEKDKYFICTGGGAGIMEASNKGAYEAGERNLGFGINLPFEQGNNPHITPHLDFLFNYFFIRKFWFAYLAKTFIVFPGGFGTLDELFEMLTLLQTKKMKKRVPVVLFGKEFYENLINTNLLNKYSLISEEDKDLYTITDDVEEAFSYITTYLEKR